MRTGPFLTFTLLVLLHAGSLPAQQQFNRQFSKNSCSRNIQQISSRF
jgi:hypothetical protein